ncbi:BTB/POZ domain-containing protein [Aspergillus udagawae]|uniref:BTB domain-containing protein n=1 Tax=Aspergillus udagawae TaxID=91492 RepID=A0A8E0QYG8_9EURO|nr:uncharacterized protein Aud_009132 [Aspergillus udagawae]GIC92662.1 hypothetical protein Aud_009132 [Aspergillus udagawae]
MNPEVNRVSDHDPNGDVILMVSPPKQPRAYAPSRLYSGEEAGVVRYRASSKHLSLASQYFEKRLKKEWREGEELQKNGCIELDVPDTDPEAFSILLDLMHCRTQEVPTLVTFDELVELAVQVDYFKCHGVVGLYPARWIEPWKAKRLNAYCDETGKWIFVSGVFNDCELYASVTCLAIRQSKDFINTLDLPIPRSVTDVTLTKEDTINLKRKVCSLLFRDVEERRHRLENGRITCSFECDPFRLGALMKQMKAHRLPWPRENLDDEGLAPESVAEKILEFEMPSSKMSGTCYLIDASGDVVLVLSAQRRAPEAKPVPSTSSASPNVNNNASINKDDGEKPSNPKKIIPVAVETPQTRFKVSSKHLTLASNYFKGHLKKRISPTSTADEPGYDEVHMLDCDPVAFLIVMNIIHGQGQRIPKEVDAAMLLKVAAVVHYLDCREACTFVVELWKKRLLDEKKVVCDTWDNCLKWAYISWALGFHSLQAQRALPCLEDVCRLPILLSSIFQSALKVNHSYIPYRPSKHQSN